MKRTDEEAVEAKDEIALLELAFERLNYSISHDLRAPLRAVVGFTRILEEDYADRIDAEGRRLLSVVAGESRRMESMIEDLLALSRLSRQPMETELVDMTALAREVSREIGLAGGRAAIVPILPAVRGDRAMLRRVWEALLSNARSATCLRDDATVHISSSREDDRVVYRVSDNGIGFDMTYAAKLFGMFQKLHSADAFPGNGASLAIVDRIVRRHGGSIWADARPAEGTTFSFALPGASPT